MINWIRVEDKLPEFGIEVLVYIYRCDLGTYDSEIQCLVYHGSPYMFAFCNEEDQCWYSYDFNNSNKLNVVAWSKLSNPDRR